MRAYRAGALGPGGNARSGGGQHSPVDQDGELSRTAGPQLHYLKRCAPNINLSFQEKAGNDGYIRERVRQDGREVVLHGRRQSWAQ